MKALCYSTILCIILVMTVARFTDLSKIPTGYYPDETSNATHIVCMAQNGTNAQGKSFPLYSDQLDPQHQGNAGQVPPTHLYFGALWYHLFGGSMDSIRAISAFWITIAIIGVFLFARIFLPIEGAILCALSTGISPIAFGISRFSGMVAFIPAFIILGCYFFLVNNKFRNAIFSAICLSLALYSYPVTRIQVPLLIIGLFLVKLTLKQIDKRQLTVFITSLSIFSIPFLLQTILVHSNRAAELFIFSPQYIQANTFLGAIKTFVSNFALYFSPDFLLFKGDPNLRHSTQFTGAISWVDSLAYIAVLITLAVSYLRKQQLKLKISNTESIFIPFTLLGIISGILPSALTWEGQPHTLRSAGMLPFLCIFSGWVLWILVKKWKNCIILIPIIATVFVICFLNDYFDYNNYPNRSKYYWDTDVTWAAQAYSKQNDWIGFTNAAKERITPYSIQYFLINYFGDNCSSSRERVSQVYGK